jgi:hypothetical protein
MPMITTTISSSMSVKPFLREVFIVCSVLEDADRRRELRAAAMMKTGGFPHAH